MVFATNSDLLTHISLQSDLVDLWYFKVLNLLAHIVWGSLNIKVGCRDTGIGKFEFEAKTFYMISLHRFSTIADSSSDGTVLYMFCELNRFNMYCVISKSLQHTFLACKKDLRRRIESKVFVFNLFEYLSLTYVTRLKHPLPLDCLRLTHYSKKNVKSKNIKYEYLLETKGQQYTG